MGDTLKVKDSDDLIVNPATQEQARFNIGSLSDKKSETGLNYFFGSAKANGSVCFISGLPVDTDQITIDDGTTAITFEFDDTGIMNGFPATLLVGTLTYTAVNTGPAGANVTIEYIDDGSVVPIVTVLGNAISIQFDGLGNTNLTTDTAIQTAVNGDISASALVTVSGAGGAPTFLPSSGPTNLVGGTGDVLVSITGITSNLVMLQALASAIKNSGLEVDLYFLNEQVHTLVIVNRASKEVSPFVSAAGTAAVTSAISTYNGSDNDDGYIAGNITSPQPVPIYTPLLIQNTDVNAHFVALGIDDADLTALALNVKTAIMVPAGENIVISTGNNKWVKADDNVNVGIFIAEDNDVKRIPSQRQIPINLMR